MGRSDALPRRDVLRLAGLGVVGSVIVTACSEANDPGGGNGNADGGSGGDVGEGSGDGGGGSVIEVTDQRGRTATFDGPVQRVVTIPMPAASILIAVDQGVDHLVAMHDASWTALKDSIMAEMFPAGLDVAHDVATQDFAPNVESIVALDPDVVVQWSDNGSGIVTPLENAGLTVLGLQYGNQDDVDTWITVFGRMLGKADRAAAMTDRIAAHLADARAWPTPSGDAPSIVYFNRFDSGLKVAAAETYNDFYIDLVGGHNPATGPDGLATPGMAGVDIEQVLAWDPDVVLLGNFDGAMPADVLDDPVWQGASAVRSGRVYKVPLGGYRWDPPSHESPLMWQWLRAVVFPDGPPQPDLRASIVEEYEFLYGVSPSDEQIDRILWVDANARSANYDRFHAA